LLEAFLQRLKVKISKISKKIAGPDIFFIRHHPFSLLFIRDIPFVKSFYIIHSRSVV
jgi:hypothetical protein